MLMWYTPVVDSGCASSRILWVTFKFSKVKVCVVVHNSTEGVVQEGKILELGWGYGKSR